MTSATSTIIDAVSPIQFSPSSVVNPASGNVIMSFMRGTSPCTINFNNQIYVFFNGSGNDGVWFTGSTDGSNWSSVDRAPGLPIVAGASPAAVVAPTTNRLFLFANQGSGVSYVSTIINTDFGNWAAPAALPDISILGTTNPSLVSFNGNIYIFYNGSGNNGIWSISIPESFSTINPPNQIFPSTQPNSFLDILEGTSPCAVVFGNQIFLFYISAGASGTTTGQNTPLSATSNYVIFATSSSDGSTWSTPQLVGTAASAGTSPTAVVAGPNPSSTALYLFWPTDPTLTATFTFDGKTWEPSGTFVVSQNAGTSASTTTLGNVPYLFWTGLNGASGGTGLGAVFSTFTPVNSSSSS